MPLPTIPNCYRVALNWEGPGATAVNVIHVGSGAGTDEGDAYEAIGNSIEGEMWNMVSSAWEITSVDITKLDGSPDAVQFAVVTSGFQGLGGASFIPQACALVRFRTATSGRKGRGRVFLPALAEDRQADGITAPPQRALCTTAWNDFQANLQAFDPVFSLGVASYVYELFSPLVSAECEAHIATQKRRNDRT